MNTIIFQQKRFIAIVVVGGVLFVAVAWLWYGDRVGTEVNPVHRVLDPIVLDFSIFNTPAFQELGIPVIEINAPEKEEERRGNPFVENKTLVIP
jgi:hypothetical protein